MSKKQEKSIDKIKRLIELLEKLNYYDDIIDNEYMNVE